MFYRLAHGSTGYRGHTCFLPQNVNSLHEAAASKGQHWLVVWKEGAESGECCTPPRLRALCLPSIHPSIHHLGSVMCMYSRVIC